ncbi:MAG: hypothetical protein M3R36_17430 [Bacteroidota bacterium]|nr:hypothetical protein [Bacteroidota bacterium]
MKIILWSGTVFTSFKILFLNTTRAGKEKYNIVRKFSLVILILFFLSAGVNHFLNPEMYLPIMPPYIPNPFLIINLSGLFEIVFSVLLIFKQSRKFAAYSLVVLLILFIPAHIHHVHISSCIGDKICFPLIAAWLRLLVIHPLLIIWVWTNKEI